MQQRKPRHLDREGLWNYALKVLGSRAHSTGELREKLKRRTEAPETAATFGENARGFTAASYPSLS